MLIIIRKTITVQCFNKGSVLCKKKKKKKKTTAGDLHICLVD